jgi:hypothetical protein
LGAGREPGPAPSVAVTGCCIASAIGCPVTSCSRITDHPRKASGPPSVVACVLVLKQFDGLTGLEAIDRSPTTCAGGMRVRSAGGTVLTATCGANPAAFDPRRIFTATTTTVAAAVGLVGIKRLLHSPPLFDAVATMDTVALIRSAIRGSLKATDTGLDLGLRVQLPGADDYRYRAAGRTACAWDDADPRAGLIDRLARNRRALLAGSAGRPVGRGAGCRPGGHRDRSGLRS